MCSLTLFACNKVSEVLYENDEPNAEYDNTNDFSETNSAVWPIAGREKICFESNGSTSISNDDSLSRSRPLHQRRTSWLPPLRFQRQSIPEASLPRFDAPSQPLLSRSQTINTNSSSEYSRNTYSSASYLSRHPSTMSTFSSLSHGSSCRSSPLNTMYMAAKPTVPKIPNKFNHEGHSLRHGGRPVRPGSRPAMPPAEFWKYASKQQVRRAPSSGSSSVFRPIAETSEREPSVCRYPIIMQPKKPLLRTRPMTVNSHVAQIKDKSYESLRKGLHSRSTNRSSSAQLRQSVAPCGQRGTDQRGEKRPERRQSRTLVKQRQPFDCDPRRRTRVA